MFIPNSKVGFSGKLVLAVPSEGFLGQRVVESLLESDKKFQHVGHGFYNNNSYCQIGDSYRRGGVYSNRKFWPL